MTRRHRGSPRRAPHRRIVLGFTLIELMIVVAIIGILAAIAIPAGTAFSCRSKSTEAKVVLRTIYYAEETYRVQEDRYFVAEDASLQDFGVDFKTKGVTVEGSRRFRYSVASTSSGFLAAAQGEGNLSSELWTIDQDNILEQVDTNCN